MRVAKHPRRADIWCVETDPDVPLGNVEAIFDAVETYSGL